ncbi:ribosome silencing factor [Eupransor demetentiae]|uniref:Ribosomal silencing factor RsfS n=1 Tax=Eupransor demetentiae TaxID=3109584 RepID=A0ABM9N5Z1_9LACO|nr:Ribosomal silencing factor RsfS [Lactobacillaceae bacterium LMG 33000]
MTTLSAKEELEIAVKAIDGKKANHVVALDMEPVSLMADYFVIADAASNRQVQAVVNEVKDKIEEAGGQVRYMEGYQQAQWVVLDLGDVIVHIFDTEHRDFYHLEKLWYDAPEVDISDLLEED